MSAITSLCRRDEQPRGFGRGGQDIDWYTALGPGVRWTPTWESGDGSSVRNANTAYNCLDPATSSAAAATRRR